MCACEQYQSRPKIPVYTRCQIALNRALSTRESTFNPRVSTRGVDPRYIARGSTRGSTREKIANALHMHYRKIARESARGIHAWIDSLVQETEFLMKYISFENRI